MSFNELRRRADEDAAAEQEKKPASKRLRKLQDFDFNINQQNAAKLIPFVLYVSAWIIIYIANHHYGEKTLGKMDKMAKEMKDLKADFYTINAELSNKSIQSEVVKMAEPLGLKPLTVPPQRMKLVKNER